MPNPPRTHNPFPFSSIQYRSVGVLAPGTQGQLQWSQRFPQTEINNCNENCMSTGPKPPALNANCFWSLRLRKLCEELGALLFESCLAVFPRTT